MQGMYHFSENGMALSGTEENLQEFLEFMEKGIQGSGKEPSAALKKLVSSVKMMSEQWFDTKTES